MKYDYVVLVDDDHVYKKEMLEIFYEQANKNLEASYSFCVYDILDYEPVIQPPKKGLKSFDFEAQRAPRPPKLGAKRAPKPPTQIQ